MSRCLRLSTDARALRRRLLPPEPYRCSAYRDPDQYPHRACTPTHCMVMSPCPSSCGTYRGLWSSREAVLPTRFIVRCVSSGSHPPQRMRAGCRPLHTRAGCPSTDGPPVPYLTPPALLAIGLTLHPTSTVIVGVLASHLAAVTSK